MISRRVGAIFGPVQTPLSPLRAPEGGLDRTESRPPAREENAVRSTPLY